MLGSLWWHSFYVYVAMLASSQYTVLISKLSCNQRGHTVHVYTSRVFIVSADRCHVVIIVSVSMSDAVCILHQLLRFPLTALLHRREWYPRPACFSITASTVVSSFEVPSHRCTSGTKFFRHYPSLRTFMDTCCHFAAVSCCNIGSLSPTLTMC